MTLLESAVEKKKQIIAMLYQNMGKTEADEALELIGEYSNAVAEMKVKEFSSKQDVSGSANNEKSQQAIREMFAGGV